MFPKLLPSICQVFAKFRKFSDTGGEKLTGGPPGASPGYPPTD